LWLPEPLTQQEGQQAWLRLAGQQVEDTSDSLSPVRQAWVAAVVTQVSSSLQPEAHSSYFIVIEYNRSQEQTLPGPMDYHHHICNDMIKGDERLK